MPNSSAFLTIPDKGHIFRAALLTFFVGLPITNGSWALIGYFHAFVFLFTVSSLLTFRNDLPSLLLQIKKQYPYSFVLFCLWWLLVSLSLINVLFNDISPFHIFAASQRYLHDGLTIAFTFTIARLLILQKISLEQIITALCLGIIFMMALHYFTYQLDAVSGFQWFRTPPLAPHMRDLGNLACVVIVSTSVLLLNQTELPTLKRQFYLFSFMASWAFLVWTGGRTGIAASAISCIFFGIYFLIFQKCYYRKLLTLLFAAIIGGYAGNHLSVFDWNGIERTTDLTEQAQSLSETTKQQNKPQAAITLATINSLTTGRAKMWQLSINAMLESPLLGLGPFGYFFIPERFYDDQPHNFIVQFLVEWGIAGGTPIFLLLLLSAFFILKKLPQKMRSADSDFLIGTSIILVLTLHGLTGGTYFKIQPFICLATGFAALLSSALHSVIQNQKEARS